MKRLVTLGLALFLLSWSADAQQPAASSPPQATSLDRGKLSYALGLDLGMQLRRQGVDIDSAIFAKAMNDALSGAKLEMTPEESRTLIASFQEELRKKQQAAAAMAAAKNKTAGEAFLAENKAKEGVVALPSGLQYKVLKPGTGPKPTADDTVECHYRGTLIDGTEFDSSYKRKQPASFPVKGVIRGWTEALQLMAVGSKWELYVPATLAYGDRGAGQTIGPNATLIFEVELIAIKGKS